MRKEMFSHEINILRDTYRRLLRRQAKTNLIKLTRKTHPADLAILFRHFSLEEQIEIFTLMNENEHTAEFLTELDDSLVNDLLSNEKLERIASIIEKAPTSDQSGILNTLEEEKAQSVIELLNVDEQEEIAEIMGYPEDSAGSLMNTEVFTLHESITAGEAIKTLQDQEDAEMVFYLYITDDDDRLVGVISLRILTTTPSTTTLKDIMIKNVHTIRPETDQEEVARIVAQYNFLAVPVIDPESHLLGIVTVDDVVDVIQDEAEEDLLRLSGVAETDIYRATLETMWGRFTWLLVNLGTAILASIVIYQFDGSLEKMVALAVLMPIVASMGGNAGTQTMTVAVRAIATRDLNMGNLGRVLGKELLVALANGGIFAILAGGAAALWYKDYPLGLVIGGAMIINMITAGLFGLVIPVILWRLRIDPATAAGVLLTTVTDVVGFLAFLGLGALFLL